MVSSERGHDIFRTKLLVVSLECVERLGALLVPYPLEAEAMASTRERKTSDAGKDDH
jgi:hypothetical protein